MSRLPIRLPRYVEPAVAGQELVGEVVGFKEVDEALELNRILGTDIGGLAEEMLGIADAPYPPIDGLATETGVDDDGATDSLTGGLQQITTTIDHVGNLLRRRNVGRVLAQVAELCQREVWG